MIQSRLCCGRRRVVECIFYRDTAVGKLFQCGIDPESAEEKDNPAHCEQDCNNQLNRQPFHNLTY